MPTTDRDVIGENEIHLRHQHSVSSDNGRAVVPMWDSSDPERAPPPLPMNPSSPSLVSKPNTSTAIQSAHVALTEKAWESGYVTNPPPKRIEYSPERLLMKGVAHKRIKSLQPNVKDLNNSLEGGTTLNGPRSLEKSPTRRGASFTAKDITLDNKSPEKEWRSYHKGRSPDRESKFTYDDKSPEKQRSFRIEEKYAVFEKDVSKDKRKDEDSNRQETPSSSHKDSQINDILKAPSTLRRPHHSILGENTPPQSATMLALQSIASKDNDSPLRVITNDSTALVRTPQAIDAISNQIISLTNIATSLQKEMAQLSRRSKDNATDLVSLKEATNARDEDIRKSLRELVQNLNENGTRQSTNAQGSGSFYLDNKAHNSSVFRGMKGFNLPRISSPASFTTSLDRESIISPASYVADGVAIIALLEKVLREMATREGQERLLNQISNYFTQSESSTEKKVDDLILLIKSNPSNSDSLEKYEGNRSRTLSLEPAPRLELDFEKSQPLSTSRVMTLKSSISDQSLNHGTAQVSEINNEDTTKLIRIIKDSVTQGGGLTAEVKALVRELRGEVLGMGREIGRKFEELNEDSTKSVTLEKEHVSRLLKNGIDDLKTHIDQILREYRRQSVSSLASKTIVDYEEVCNAVRDAVIQIDQSRNKDFEKQDILDAVKDAWENYKPEIEFQQFGLERDELLTCLEEGLQKYAPQNAVPVISGATREEVHEAIVDGLKNLSLPCIETPASNSREEILIAFREILDEFEFPSTYSKSIENGITKEAVLEAVNEGLRSFDFSTSIISSINSTNTCLTRNEIIEAIKDGIKEFEAPKNINEITFKATENDESSSISRDVPRIDAGHRPDIDSFISQICDKFKNILDSTRTELEIVSKEAKKNLYSSTDITEKLLETTRDGIEKIQSDMGEFVGKASGYEVKDNIDEIKTRIDSLREEVEWLTSSNSSDSSESVLTEIKNIRDILLTTTIPNSEDGNSKVLDSLQEGLESIKQIVSSSLVLPSPAVDENKILLVLKDGLDIIKEQVSVSRIPAETSPEQMIILDTIKDDLENIKKTISSLSTSGSLELARDDIVDVSSSSLIHRSSELDKDDIINAMKNELEVLKDTISSSLQHERPELDNFEALNTIKHDFESLKQSISPFMVSDSVDSSNDRALIALRKSIEDVKEEINTQQGFTDHLSLDKILETIKFELSNVQIEIGKVADYTIGSKGTAINQDIQKTLQDGLESIRADINELRNSFHDEKPETHNNSSIVPLDLVRRDHVDSFESYAAEPQVNTQEIEAICSPPSESAGDPFYKNELEDLMKNIQSSLDNLAERSQNLKEEHIGREDLEAIENVVRNTKARFDDVDFKQLINKEDLNPLELLIGGTQDDLGNLAVHLENVSKKDDVGVVESITRDVLINVESLKDLLIKTAENPEVRKEDISAVESTCSEIKCMVDKMLTTEISSLASKDDFQNLEAQVKEFKEQINDYAENNTKLSEDHHLEVANVNETLVVIQKFLEKFEDTVQKHIGDSIEKIQSDMGEFVGKASGYEVKDNIDEIKTRIDSLREEVEWLTSSNSSDSSESVLTEIKNIRDILLTTTIPNSEDGNSKVLDSLQEGLESIKQIVSSSLVLPSPAVDENKILLVLKDGLDIIKEQVSVSRTPAETSPEQMIILDTIKDDLENIKKTISSLSTSGSLELARDDIVDVSSSSLIHRSSELDKDDIINAMKNELEVLKDTDYIIGSKGTAINQDIQKTLQDGLESIRADINELRNSFHDEKPETHNNSSIVPLDLVRRDHVDSFESYAAEPQVNTQEIEAICSPPSESAGDPFYKNELEDLMKNIQSSLDNLAERSQNLKEEHIGREDLEAIENVVRNTKARFDDVDFKQLINKEDLNPLELLIGGTQDDLGNLAVHLENVSKKDDVGVVESITRDVLINVESLKDLLIKTAENPEVRKEDISAVESTCSEIKCMVDKMLTTEISSLASKDDFQNLEAQVKEFKEQINDYAENNTKLSEDHHLEVANVNETLVVIQKFLEKFEDTVQENIGDNVKRTKALGVLLEEFSKILSQNANVSEDVRLLSDVVKDEIEKSTAAVVGSKLELDEKLQQNCDKIDDIFEKRFGDLLIKFDDTRVLTEGVTKASEEKLNQIEATLNETQTATEDLKLLAGHLSSSFTESRLTLDKSSQLIIDRVEETNDRLKEAQIDTKIEHQQTRENINKILCMIEGIDSTLKENSPKITESLRDLCLITHKQNEDSRISISTLEEKISERMLRFEPPTLCLPPPPESHEIFIDSSAHEKLDKIVNGMNIASKSFSQLDMLEKIHQQVIKTAAEVKEYFNAQTKQIYDDYEEKKRATEEVSSILERKIAQKESAEDTVNSLRQEEEHLRSSISDLKIEQEGLTRKKIRLNAEVAGLETALKIRREELDIMEERAGSLERRILESVIDQSRTLLISKTNKGREAMSRKRVPSHNSSGNSPSISKSMNMSQIAVEMVKTGNRSAKKNSQNNSRRILSLSQITDNASPGSLNRCHSVKTPSGVLRKNSWGGTISLNHDHLNEKNLRKKENEDVITEFDPNYYDDVLSSNSVEVILPKSAGSRISEVTMEDGTTRSLERSDGDIDILSEVETPVTAEIEPTDTFVVL